MDRLETKTSSYPFLRMLSAQCSSLYWIKPVKVVKKLIECWFNMIDVPWEVSAWWLTKQSEHITRQHWTKPQTLSMGWLWRWQIWDLIMSFSEEGLECINWFNILHFLFINHLYSFCWANLFLFCRTIYPLPLDRPRSKA